MYATRKSTTGTFTCNGKVELSQSNLEYETVTDRSAVVLVFGIGVMLAVIAIVWFLAQHS